MRTGSAVTEPLFPDSFLKKIERLSLVARRQKGQGAIRPDRKGGRQEFADHRAYVRGDDLRYVDWHLFGRHGQLFLKEFAREEEAEVFLVLDTSASMETKIAGALRLAAALCVVGLARGDRVRVATAADGGLSVSRSLEGEGRRGELLGLLAAIENRTGGGTDLDASLRVLPPRRGPGRRLLVLVSDLLTESDGRRALAQAGSDAVVLQWLSEEERHPTAAGRVRLVDAEGGEIEAFVGPDEAARYRDALEEHLTALHTHLVHYGVRHLLAPAEASVEDLVLDLMVREGVLR